MKFGVNRLNTVFVCRARDRNEYDHESQKDLPESFELGVLCAFARVTAFSSVSEAGEPGSGVRERTSDA
jgi:hypothetical protein